MVQAWRKATPKILMCCASLAVARTFIMSLFGKNVFVIIDVGMNDENREGRLVTTCDRMMSLSDVDLYWVYDRQTSVWHMTKTEWTAFYEE